MQDYKYYAIMNKRTKRFIHGTNYDRSGQPVQIYNDEYRPPLLLSEGELSYQINLRHINLKTFEVVRIKVMAWKDED